MFKLFKELINVLSNIHGSLLNINGKLYNIDESIKIRSTDMEGIKIKISDLATSQYEIKTNIYTKEQTVEQINKEYDYRKRYEECEKENEDILYLIQDYFNYKDKYQVLDLFDEINKKYKIERKVK